jgi:uncharacterized membrane protein
MTWFIFAFLTAIFESTKDIASKKALLHSNSFVVAWSWMVFPPFFVAPLLLFTGFPEVDSQFWIAAVAIGLCNTLSFNLYMKAIMSSDLSMTVPMIAFTPLFLLVTSPIIVGEFPDAMGLIGVLLIVLGSYVLNIGERHNGFAAPYKALLRQQGPRLMLGVAFIWSIAANIDKVGVLHSSPLAWILVADTVTALFMTPLVLWQVGKVSEVGRGFRYLIVIGLLSTLVSLSQMTAITMTLVAYVIAVKRTSVIMSVLSGALIFKEQGLRERLLGVVIMIAGVVFITVL